MTLPPAEPSTALTAPGVAEARPARVERAEQLDDELVREILDESETRGIVGAIGAGGAMAVALALALAPFDAGANVLLLLAASAVAVGVDVMRLRATSKTTGVAARLLLRVELAYHREAMRLSWQELRAGRFRKALARRSAETRDLTVPRVLARLQKGPGSR